jgi:phage-related protein
MSLVVRELKKGLKYSLWGIGYDDGCKTEEYLADLSTKDPDAFDKINALLDKSIDHGPPNNKEKCKHLKGTDKLFEFKTGDGVRILWFWDANYMMISTHGFTKKKDKTPAKEIDYAEKMKKAYECAKKNGTLKSIPLLK